MKWIAKAVGVAYVFLYLSSIGNLALSEELISFKVLEDWQQRILVQRVDFVWEPIATITFFHLSVFIAPLNIAIAVLLAFLVSLNVELSLAIRERVKKGPFLKHSLATVPSLISGFACCLPTFLIPFGSAVSGIIVPFIAVRPFLIPLSVALMSLSYIYSKKQLTSR